MANKAAIARILSCDSSDPYKTLALPSTSSVSAVRRRYKTLALSLHPDKHSGAAAEEAFKRVSAAFQLLTDGKKKGGEEGGISTFWTACGACRLLHEFDRRYVGYRLVCPRCRRSFLATEVPGPDEADQEEEEEDGEEISVEVNKPTSSVSQAKASDFPPMQKCDKKRKQSESGASTLNPKPKRKPEKTLAEIQLELTKKIKRSKEKEDSNKKTKQEFDEQREETEKEMVLMRRKKSNLGLMTVEDSDFYNFDSDRNEKSFKKGQIWAVYDDDDGMPRHYGLIQNVLNSKKSFKIKLCWLDLHFHEDKSRSHFSCGKFKSGKSVDLDSVNLFSHSIRFEQAARELYRIYPKKGSIWALYKSNINTESTREYEIVLVLTSFDEKLGLSFVRLEKVEGYKTVFRKPVLGSEAVRFVEREEEIRVFSHQIPSRKLTGEDLITGLEGFECWELDPASLPPQLLCIAWEREKIMSSLS
ncbi:hypothetical protein LUZ60_007323 [Juncus effusus]|nr:hypothetical protein LUZ60_007323 [Juncus effusus]